MVRISLSKKFVFLANPKCASTSVRSALTNSKCVNFDEKSGLDSHINYCEAKKFLLSKGYDIADFYVVTTLRNPWHRVISLYEYGRYDANIIPFWLPNHDKSTERTATFKDFVIHEVPNHAKKFALDVFVCEDGVCKVNDIVPIEDVEKLAQIPLKLIGKSIKVNKENQTTKKSEYIFTDEMNKVIEDCFKMDIVVGKYSNPYQS